MLLFQFAVIARYKEHDEKYADFLIGQPDFYLLGCYLSAVQWT